MKIAKLCWVVLLAGACSQEPGLDTGLTTQNVNGTTTTIRMNGRAALVFLTDGDASGQLTASKDQVNNTSAIDFGYAFPDPTNGDNTILIFGAGSIPNSAFTATDTTATLNVTTSFEVQRCVISDANGVVCAPTTAKTFNLTWAADGFSTSFERTNRLTTIGPVTERFHGALSSRSAIAGGTWDGHNTPDLAGQLLDTQSQTFIKEITVETP